MLKKDKQSFFSLLRIKNLNMLFFKLVIVFVPTFLVAFFIDKMVFVLPTLALGLLLGAGLDGLDVKSKDNEENDGGDS